VSNVNAYMCVQPNLPLDEGLFGMKEFHNKTWMCIVRCNSVIVLDSFREGNRQISEFRHTPALMAGTEEMQVQSLGQFVLVAVLVLYASPLVKQFGWNGGSASPLILKLIGLHRTNTKKTYLLGPCLCVAMGGIQIS